MSDDAIAARLRAAARASIDACHDGLDIEAAIDSALNYRDIVEAAQAVVDMYPATWSSEVKLDRIERLRAALAKVK